jgi:hypothetical protein
MGKMKSKQSNPAVFWRFGVLGIFLYKKLHEKKQWKKKGYIFTRFMGAFFLFFTFLTTSVKASLNFNSRLVIAGIVLLCSIGYGYWAELFFRK